MNTFGNIIWFIIYGLWAAIVNTLAGCLYCITIIGIPVGLQLFKVAKFVIWPFGKTVTTHFEKHPVLNILWIIFFGWEQALATVIYGLILCVTIIGIPFGKQCFKLTGLYLLPFGAEIN